MIHLQAVRIKAAARRRPDFPFNVPAIRALDELAFTQPVTFLVGENGSGKSTLLEALACAIGSITVGAESVTTDPTLSAIRTLARQMQLIWRQRTRRGFFMRAEDFFNFARRINQMRDELDEDLARVEEEYADRSDYAKGLARMAYAGQRAALEDSYGAGLETHSHGEAYFNLFQSRFVPGGLYLLDEPEVPLSPLRQLAFLTMLHQMVAQDAQFIIATHSPLLMAYPHATLLHFAEGTIRQVAYEELEHVTLTRAFLNNPQTYLDQLLGDEPEAH